METMTDVLEQGDRFDYILESAGVNTWNSGTEFLVIFDNATIVHTIQHINGEPIITAYQAASRC